MAILWLVFLSSAGCRFWQTTPAAISDRPAKSFEKETLTTLAAKLSRNSWKRNLSWTPEQQYEVIPADAASVKSLRWTLTDDQAEEMIADIDSAGPAIEPGSHEASTLNEEDWGHSPSHKEPPGNSLENELTEELTAEASTESTAEKTETISWDGFFPLSTGDMLDLIETDPDENSPSQQIALGNDYLSQLAQRDELAGWNAAILLARRDPHHALHIAPILERLVTSKQSPTGNRHDTHTDPEAADKPAETERTEEEPSRFKPFRRNQETKTDGKQRPAKMEKFVPSRVQSAAAEAWCILLAANSDNPVDGLAPIGHLLERSDIADHLRIEFYLGLARWAVPASIPRLENALRGSEQNRLAPDAIRRAAIETCLIYALAHNDRSDTPQQSTALYDESEWPATVLECRQDPDAGVRRTFGRWLVAAGHPQAFEMLKAQLADVQLRVREDALLSLGRLGTREAANELRIHATSTKERIRALAARGLSHWGVDELTRFADDSAYFVRKALAEELSGHPNAEAAFLLHKLLIDQSSEVQKSAVSAVDNWPDKLAFPLLLFSMQESYLDTRKMSWSRLRARKKIKQPFPFDAHPQKRAEVIAQIVRDHSLPQSFLEALQSERLSDHTRTDEVHATEVHAYLTEFVNHRPQTDAYLSAQQRLLQLGEQDISIIEDYLRGIPEAQAYAIYRHVLPKLSPVYQALLELKSSDVIERRRGAVRLAQIGADISLSAHAVHLLKERLAAEQDTLVWRYAMAAVFEDDTDESAQIAQLAINHTWPDIREQGCRYFIRHGHPRFATWLHPLLGDTSQSVQLLAIKAAGHCRSPVVLEDKLVPGTSEQFPGLRTLQTDANRQVRFAATIAMSRLGAPEGILELIRLASDPNATIRETVVKEMAQTGQTRFVRHLILLGWTENNDRVKHAILESLELLSSPQKRPPGLVHETRDDAKINLWNEWWQQQQQQSVSFNEVSNRPQPATREVAWESKSGNPNR